MIPQVQVVSNRGAMVRAALDHLHAALAGSGERPVVGVSGGHTPQPFYDALAAEAKDGRLPRTRIHWVIGDERVVPPDHPRSNLGMIRKHLFEPGEIPATCIHPMPAILPDRGAAVAACESDLKQLYGADELDPARPFFDFLLLGLGEDGHIASLFPGAAALGEVRRWVLQTRAPDGEARMSLTLPVLGSARHILFLVQGAGKRDALARWRAGDASLPASQLNPPCPILVVADAEAAGD